MIDLLDVHEFLQGGYSALNFSSHDTVDLNSDVFFSKNRHVVLDGPEREQLLACLSTC